ncbi:hypothetical protein LX69_00593 [Breznakibacter xylanolyticus]|uniref:Uncharacterized protein n=1 Tax=Breznakibacter xylanolyticus TaxID=990 RepID=A0A2W7QE24_9BACT|nr:hypothetical protein [Breznakibacter xylanolyticus]PZX20139.1 hypothetical protein LX69_00593 [Breznakibacter xylanolyticus]
MAKQSGIIKLEGTIGDITFYKSKDGMLARAKGGVDGDRIKSDAAFARTRENGLEFARAGSAGKLLRMAFRAQLMKAADNRMVSRLTKQMMVVVKADATSIRGQRNVLDGELELLTGFDFNLDGKLSSTLYAQYGATIDRVSGELEVTIPAFSPDSAIVAPEGATHFRFISAGASIDFEGNVFEAVTSQTGELSLSDGNIAAVTLTNTLTANSTHPLFLVLGIEFYQMVNGVSYSLKNGRYNALSLVSVSGL